MTAAGRRSVVVPARGAVMRGTLLVGLVLAAGCASNPGAASTPDGKADPKGKKDAAPAFNPKDVAETGRWLAHELNKSRDFPEGNAIAGKAAVKGYQDTLKKLTGEKVEWVAECAGVLDDGRVGLKMVTFEHAGNGPKRTYILYLSHNQGGGAPQHFPVGKPDWVAKAKPGDKLVIKGELHAVDAETVLSADKPALGNGPFAWRARFLNFEIAPAK